MSSHRTGDQKFLRQQNLIGVIHHLYDNAPISRAELAALTGLNKTTVSSLIGELLANRFVREIGSSETISAGRRRILLDLDPARGFIVSGEIDKDSVDVICTDFKFKILWRHTEPLISSEQNEALPRVFEILQKAIEFAAEQGNLLGLAVGVHGLLDKQTGTLLFAPNSGWRNVPLLEMLRARFQIPIFIDNEANFAALGEQYFGAATGFSEVLYLSAGSGLGGGLVVNGQIYNGADGLASEFGHITFNPDGLLCQCGNRGCWETEVNQTALLRHVGELLAEHPTSVLQRAQNAGESQLSIEEIVLAARGGDSAALAALEKVARALGVGLASLINVINPGLIVFGGNLSIAADFLFPVIHQELHVRSLSWSQKKVKVAVARFGADAALKGGVAKVFQAFLSAIK